MLPIYDAVGYSNKILEGGTSKPLIFTVNEKGQLSEYVVKVFKKKDLKQYNPLSKECFAYLLATEFSLPQPDAAIVEFKEDILEVIPEEIKNRILESGSLYHYATKLIDNYILFSHSLTLNDLSNYDIETLFAFDVFIHNTDRIRKKPNLLVSGSDYFLIDHDHSLLITEVFLEHVREEDFSFLYNNDRLQSHIFVPYLKKANKNKMVTFDEFDYHLNSLNINKLKEIKYLLEKIKIDSSDYYIVKEYISELKEKRSSFIKSLRYFL